MNSNYATKIRELLNGFIAHVNSHKSSDISSKPLPNKWSKKEILGHLIDSAYNNHRRFLNVKSKENLIFAGYDQNEWVARNNYQQRDEKEIIALFLSVNYHIAKLIDNLSLEALDYTTENHNFDKICMNHVEKGKPASLRYLVEDYIFHLEHHLGQIFFRRIFFN